MRCLTTRRTPLGRLGVLTGALLFARLANAAEPPKPAPKGANPKAGPGAAAPAADSGFRLRAANLGALKARPIGPAIMGGRVSDIAVSKDDPATFYVGLATGGVLKTANAGATFDAVFEKEAVASIGAIAVAPSDTKVVWAGTGEANDRNSSGWGAGVFRSTDAGETWAQAGLKESRAIARIAVHPGDPGTAWVAAMGDLWLPGGERGLFKTTDGGKTWKTVLSAPPPYQSTTGCGDVVLDPSDPNTVYATLYARQRSPWSFTYGTALTDGKDIGGIYKTTDGGTTWKRLDKGLPGKTGRIGLDVSRSNPRIVYAVVQTDEGGTAGIMDIRSRKGGVFRSEDGGDSWQRRNDLNPRPFYFSQIRVDPLNDQRVYVLGFMLHVSDDGGRSFREDLFEKVHSDLHALAFVTTPNDLKAPAAPAAATVTTANETKAPPRPPISSHLLIGTDGGVYQSHEAGKNWAHLDRIASGQFYRIGLDMATPYRICGGLQDNVNWVGPSRTNTKDGIVNADWMNVQGGDGFYCVFDPSDPDIVYAESQEGYLHRFNMRTGEQKDLRPSPPEGQPAFRFHWNSPLLGSVHEKGALYLAGNRVFKLTERGEIWKVISPDLSTNDPAKTTATGSGAENYGVVYTLAESPIRPGLLWAGTDDGKLWITENGGERWTDLTVNLPTKAKGQWISRIEPGNGPSGARVATVAIDGHRTGIHAPLLFRTSDGGASWQSIAGDLPPNGPVRVVREDPRNPDVLYAGTEFGLFVTFDRGKAWHSLGTLPTVAVDDLAIHPRDHDLVIATHGRSLYVLDDIASLGELTPEIAKKGAYLFKPRPVHGSYLLPGWEESNGKAVFRGENPPEGALLTYWVRESSAEPAKIAIATADGRPVANLKVPSVEGLGRVSWDLRPTKDLLIEYGGLGPKKLVSPGEYIVTLTSGTGKDQVKVEQKLLVTIAQGIETR